MFNKEMQTLGEERSVIRELFEYGARRKREIGAENVFDFSLGNPGVPAPACVEEEILRLLREVPGQVLHGYTSAPGLYEVRKAVADDLKARFGADTDPDLVYMTCGASASLTVALCALCNASSSPRERDSAPTCPHSKAQSRRAQRRSSSIPPTTPRASCIPKRRSRESPACSAGRARRAESPSIFSPTSPTAN